MFGLLDDDAPVPAFSFSALLALIASAATCAYGLHVVWMAASTRGVLLILAMAVAYAMISVPAILAALLCGIAAHLRQKRWAMVGFALISIPVAAAVVVLLYRFVRRLLLS